MNHEGIYFNGHRRDVGMELSPAVLVARLIGMWNTLKLAILLASEKRDVPSRDALPTKQDAMDSERNYGVVGSSLVPSCAWR